ncbi:hypothetical protein P5G65_07635 [Paenibacillus chondroitinus]|uniref:Uncharacterized protein n=1 Tax=Paenibacillus chondroitinus TaxID=59842 RepID=A0ABU6DA03_9BACL|nr:MULTISPECIES: hypothetical protein [Paenibacillus]MCY9661676.1 hypothetical protein [Paenibacillus anseongense]MEB4793761.1 hypothetical protein [Paenibacillus chondroitinus]
MKTDMTRGRKVPATQEAFGSDRLKSIANGISAPIQMLQTAHRTIGNRAVQRMVEQSHPKIKEHPGQGAAIGPVVQRLEDSDSFKKSTPVMLRPMNKIKNVDSALVDYHKLAENDYAKRSTQLEKIITECNTYVDNKPKKDLVPGVNELKRQAIVEKSVIELIAQAEGKSGTQKFYTMVEAQDKWLLVKGDVPGLGGIVFGPMFDKIIVELRATPGAIEEVLQHEADQLKAIADDPDTPDITKQVLAEVLGNMGEIKMNALNPGARFTNDKEKQQGVQEKYVVNHGLNAPGGSAERLGSLTHEFTHVSISEKFDNTPLFFAFDPSTSEDEVMQLVNKRHQHLDKLISTLASGGFSQEQLSLLNMKLEYPRKGGPGGVQRYITNFFQSKKITAQEKQKAESLVNKGMDNTVIEFDTVINQMLIYMHQWKIAMDNPFYKLLRTVAEDAYNYRMGA